MGGRLRGGGGFIHPRAPRVRTNPYFRRIHKRGVRNPVSNIGTNEPPISVTRTERVPWTGTRCPPNRTSLRSSLPHTLTDPASHHPVRRLTESETRLGLTENAARKLGTNRERGVTETARVRTIRRKRAGERQRRRERERSRSYGGALAAPNGKPGTSTILCRPVPSDPTYSTLPLSIRKRTNASPF